MHTKLGNDTLLRNVIPRMLSTCCQMFRPNILLLSWEMSDLVGKWIQKNSRKSDPIPQVTFFKIQISFSHSQFNLFDSTPSLYSTQININDKHTKILSKRRRKKSLWGGGFSSPNPMNRVEDRLPIREEPVITQQSCWVGTRALPSVNLINTSFF